MKAKTSVLIEEQDAVLEAMGTLRVMRRGTLSTQVYAERQARRSGKGACGPYHVVQGYREGRHFSERVSEEAAGRIKQDIARRKDFETLCARYVDLAEALAHQADAEAIQEAALKKSLGGSRAEPGSGFAGRRRGPSGGRGPRGGGRGA